MMKRLMIALCVVVGLTVVGAGTAQASGGGCQCSTPVASAPQPAATVAQGQPTTSYRTYSYQPTTYQSAPAYRSYNRSAAGGFHDAAWKARGGN